MLGRSIVVILAPIAAMATSCQLIAGLGSLETVEGTGGAGGGSAPCGMGAMPPPADTCAMDVMCDSCSPSDEMCTIDCSDAAECDDKTLDLHAEEHGVRLECGAFCNNATIECMGPHPCIVSCTDPSGCIGLTIHCSPDDECRIDCAPNACTGGPVTVNCGDRQCLATCDPSAQVSLECNGACECTPC